MSTPQRPAKHDLHAPTVLVTGGAHRLGALLCRQFTQAGWTVWCHYQRSEEAAQTLQTALQNNGGTVHLVCADLSDDAERQRMMETIEQQTGPLTCLINNASSFEPDSAQLMNIEEARQQLEVNLLAPLALTSLMARSPTGSNQRGQPGQRSIIHVLDQKVFNLNPDYFSYTVSKLALERSVALQAQALAPDIRVCGVAPGLMYLSGPQTQKNFDRASKINLMQSTLDPESVAATCLFLAQNRSITGVSIAVDNGQHLVPLARDVMFAVEQPDHPKDPL